MRWNAAIWIGAILSMRDKTLREKFFLIFPLPKGENRIII